MAELLPQERLQPALLDRLLDNERDVNTETIDKRVLNKSQLRQAVLRDLEWLFNSVRLPKKLMAGAPHVARSVLNFGLPSFAGETATQIETRTIEDAVREAMVLFEPRIDPASLSVEVVLSGSVLDTHNLLQLQIRGQLWAQPMPLELLLKSAVNLETGQITVSEGSVRSAPRDSLMR